MNPHVRSRRRNPTKASTRSDTQGPNQTIGDRIAVISERAGRRNPLTNSEKSRVTTPAKTRSNRPLVSGPPRGGNRNTPKPAIFTVEKHGSLNCRRATSYKNYIQHVKSSFNHSNIKSLASSYRENVPVVSEHVIHSLPATYHEEGAGAHARCRLHAVELLTSVGLDAAYDAENAGNELVTVPLHPRYFSNTRALVESRSWTEWKLHRCRFIYVPSVPATAQGNLLMFVEQSSTPPLFEYGDAAVRYGLSNPSVLFQTWNETSLEFKDGSNVVARNYVASQASPDVGIEGVFRLVLGSDVAAADVAGMILIEYDLEFFNPVLDIGLSNYAQVLVNITFSMTAYTPDKGDPVHFSAGGTGPQFTLSGFIPSANRVYIMAGHICGNGASPTFGNLIEPVGYDVSVVMPELGNDETLPVYAVYTSLDSFPLLLLFANIQAAHAAAKSLPGASWDAEGILGAYVYVEGNIATWTGVFHGRAWPL